VDAGSCATSSCARAKKSTVAALLALVDAGSCATSSCARAKKSTAAALLALVDAGYADMKARLARELAIEPGG
jgi:hypothetical protein